MEVAARSGMVGGGVRASCVSNVIRAVWGLLAPVLVLDFAPTRRGSRQSQRGRARSFLVCVSLAQSTFVFILTFPFATSRLSLSIAPVRCSITPLRCGLILSFFLLLSSVTRCFGQSRQTVTPSGCQLLHLSSTNSLLASFLIRLFDPRA